MLSQRYKKSIVDAGKILINLTHMSINYPELTPGTLKSNLMIPASLHCPACSIHKTNPDTAKSEM